MMLTDGSKAESEEIRDVPNVLKKERETWDDCREKGDEGREGNETVGYPHGRCQ